MADIQLRQISSLEKVFLNRLEGQRQEHLLACGGEAVSYQLAYTAGSREEYQWIDAKVRIESPLSPYIRVYRVEHVPAAFPAYPDRHDDDYITTAPGLFPDPLYPLENGELEILPGQWRALWIEISVPAGCRGGEYTVEIQIECGGEAVSETMKLTVLAVDLPAQTLKCTNWFHVDCIADIHHVKIYSEAHWALLQKYMQMAAEHGINTLLTPVLTPPLDTRAGGERPTVQLVEITKTGGGYQFDFARLARYIEMAEDCGVRYFEINQMFTQWGANAAPKVVACVDGVEKRIFGWDTPAQSPAYLEFLKAFLPALVRFLDGRGLQGRAFFHVSDEPGPQHLDSYRAAAEAVRPLVGDYPVMDALSDFGFWKQGITQHPIVATDHIGPFLENGCQDLWCYYCCAQCVDVANRYLAMPSYRNRILGVQMYKYNIAGFLQWGFNFYYSALSRRLINPYTTTDALGAFPAGDPFVVYPWLDGVIPSLRLKVFREALQDMRLLTLAERYAGREAVLSVIAETAGGPLTFSEYPREDGFIFQLRQKAFQMLSKYIH